MRACEPMIATIKMTTATIMMTTTIKTITMMTNKLTAYLCGGM